MDQAVEINVMRELLQALIADREEPTQESQATFDWDPPSEMDPPVVQRGSAATTAETPAPTLELHPNAQANFDSKGEELLAELVRSPADAVVDQPRNTDLEREQLAERLPEHTIRGSVETFRDAEGLVTGRCFIAENEIVGLQGLGHRHLRELAENIQRTQSLRSIVGVDVMEQMLFEWVRARTLEATALPVVEYVLKLLRTRLGKYEIVLPLFRVELPSPIQIGRVQLRPIRAADFERWIGVAGGLNTLQSRMVFDQAQRKMQGWAAATLSIQGEEHYALDVARQEADEAVAILRLFTPSILSPVSRSFCALWGRHNLESTEYVMMQKDSGRLSLGARADTRQDYVWRITTERLELIKRDALDTITRSMYFGTRTDFQDEVRSALLLYSKSALRSTPAEKLLAILIPMESLLLRTQSEPITDTIATRLAFAVGTDFDERKQIADVTRQAYALRSGYVHHGREIHALKDLDVLREFMRYAWMLFMEIAARSADYAERIAYLGTLDDRKFA